MFVMEAKLLANGHHSRLLKVYKVQHKESWGRLPQVQRAAASDSLAQREVQRTTCACWTNTPLSMNECKWMAVFGMRTDLHWAPYQKKLKLNGLSNENKRLFYWDVLTCNSLVSNQNIVLFKPEYATAPRTGGELKMSQSQAMIPREAFTLRLIKFKMLGSFGITLRRFYKWSYNDRWMRLARANDFTLISITATIMKLHYALLNHALVG